MFYRVTIYNSLLRANREHRDFYFDQLEGSSSDPRTLGEMLSFLDGVAASARILNQDAEAYKLSALIEGIKEDHKALGKCPIVIGHTKSFCVIIQSKEGAFSAFGEFGVAIAERIQEMEGR